MLLYVMAEHPSASQTFVLTEAAAVEASGVRVVGYALRRGRAAAPAAPFFLICPPPTKRRLLLALMRALPQTLALLWTARTTNPTPSEAARLLLAQAHASHAERGARAIGVTHIHAHFLGRPADVADALAHRLTCKWTVTSHGADAYAPREPALHRRRLDSTAGVACANRTVQQALHKHTDRRSLPTRLVHCGVNLAQLRFELAPDTTSGPHLVTIGRLVTTKGYWTVLAAAHELLPRHPELRWTIIGGGPLDGALRSDSRYRSLHPRLALTGPMTHPSALAHLAGAAAFVLPCERDDRGGSDGIPVALVEAMALGVPVVTTSVGGIPELVVDRTTGFVVTPRDPASLIATLEAILYPTDDAALRRIRLAARSKVDRDFNAMREAAKLISFFSDLGVIARPG